MQSEVIQSEEMKKKIYVEPELVELGNVSTITLISGSGPSTGTIFQSF